MKVSNRLMYVLITPTRVRIYSSRDLGFLVLDRLRRMFPAGSFELTADAVRMPTVATGGTR